MNSTFLSNIIKAGYCVFPCDRNKKPLTEHSEKTIALAFEYTNALLADDRIHWQRAIYYNNAILCGEINKLLVVDIDRKNGGIYQWNELLKIHNNGLDIKTFKVRTPSGGVHYYFKTNEETINISTHFSLRLLSNFLSGIDLLANNGYALLPYSMNTNNIQYLPYKGSLIMLLNKELPELPDWLWKELKKQ